MNMPTIKLLANKHIVLGVTGSIAAYKAADLASKLTQAGARVDVILTEAATRFVTPLTFSALTGRPARTDGDLWDPAQYVPHVALGEQADLLLIAPATADFLAKLAHGLADDLLSVTALAARGPLLVAPAMDGAMYAHPATQANLAALAARGVTVLGPVEGRMASGLSGLGRMLEPAELLAHVRYKLAEGGPLRGRRLVVTAGGTQESIDPVRFVTNRSSGKQGYALAQAALDRGAEVVLITASDLEPPAGARVVRVRTAQEMLTAVLAEVAQADVLLMAAAVADYRPSEPAGQKLKKHGEEPLRLVLEQNADILKMVAAQKAQTGHPTVTVGFAAETAEVLSHAREKLRAKGLDLMVANDVAATDAGFEVDTNRVTLLDAGGGLEQLPLLSKVDVAEHVLDRVMRSLP
jgi:phosphopantothenoylcysteine decarboxylase/phosphopantothenate--cysteine ligase